MMLTFEEWRHWHEGAKHRVVVLTDHKNLTYLESAKRLNPRQARWSLFFFSRFDFVVSYFPGSKNVKADALSRSFVPDSPGLPEPAGILKEGLPASGPGVSLSALTDQAEGAAHTICVIAPSDLDSQSADAGKMEAPGRWSGARWLERGQFPLTAIHLAVQVTMDSIATGSVPQDWRIANVVPIFKKGSKSDPGNYRPVSLTSIVGKIFEGFLRDVILDYLNENNCLTPYQHGFMRNRSCQTNLISFYEEVSYRLDHANFIEHFSNLTSFTMRCTYCPGLENIISSLCKNGKMKELRFPELGLYDKEIIHLAKGLAYLEQLEEFTFPGGHGVRKTMAYFMEALQHMPNLVNLTIQCQLLTDSSLLELAKITADGHLRNLQYLDINNNPHITQSGWREFFLLMDNLPKLTDLNISRSLSHQQITDPVTFIAFTQCVSRLHSVNVLSMFGWLLDDKDIEMFDSMKMRHPQSKWINLYYKWALPFPPLLTK
ncbi:unnamed protein product, partial [Ranitomeya imitator]